jgi:hypothetical protein
MMIICWLESRNLLLEFLFVCHLTFSHNELDSILASSSFTFKKPNAYYVVVPTTYLPNIEMAFALNISMHIISKM